MTATTPTVAAAAANPRAVGEALATAQHGRAEVTAHHRAPGPGHVADPREHLEHQTTTIASTDRPIASAPDSSRRSPPRAAARVAAPVVAPATCERDRRHRLEVGPCGTVGAARSRHEPSLQLVDASEHRPGLRCRAGGLALGQLRRKSHHEHCRPTCGGNNTSGSPPALRVSVARWNSSAASSARLRCRVERLLGVLPRRDRAGRQVVQLDPACTAGAASAARPARTAPAPATPARRRWSARRGRSCSRRSRPRRRARRCGRPGPRRRSCRPARTPSAPGRPGRS